MDTIVTNREFDNLFRKEYKKRFMTVFYIMLSVSLLEILVGVILSVVYEEGFMEVGVYMLIPVAFLLPLGIIFYVVAKRADREDFNNFVIDKYTNYKAIQFKHPLYRIVQYGRSQDIIQQVLEINGDLIKITDLKKRKENLYVNTTKALTTFKFFVKDKNGQEIYKTKIVIESNGKKVTVYGYQDYNHKLYNYLRAQGFKVMIK